MTDPAPTDAAALREALARTLCIAQGADPDFDYDPKGIVDTPGVNVAWKLFLPSVDALIAGPLASLLAARATTDADLAKARDRIAGLEAELSRRPPRPEPGRQCPRCGISRGMLPACAQEGCPTIDRDGKPMKLGGFYA